MKHLRKNAIHNVLGWLLPTLVFFALTPIMINRLGVEAFGIISLVQLVTGYMTVLNFGFSEAIIKQVAEAYDKDAAQLRRVVWVGAWLFAGSGVIGAVLLFATANWVAFDLLKVSDSLREDTRKALQIGAAVFLFQMLAEFYRGTAMGAQRFDIPNLCRILRIALSGLFILLALHLELGMAGVMWGTLGGLVIGFAVNAVWMERLLPLRKATGDLRPVWVEVAQYSKHVFAMRLAGVVSQRLAQFFLGTLSSAANVALYEVPVRAAGSGSAFLNRITQVFFPGFAAMNSATEMERIRRIFLLATSLQLLVITPFFLGMALEGPTLLALWINPEFAKASAGIILPVCVAFWLASLTNLPTFLALAFGMPHIVSKYSVISMIVTLVVGYPLVSNFGLMGAALVLLATELPSLFMIPEPVRRHLGSSTASALLKRMAAHFGIALAIYLCYELMLRPSAVYSLWWLMAVPMVYLALALSMGLIGPDERRRLHGLLLQWQ